MITGAINLPKASVCPTNAPADDAYLFVTYVLNKDVHCFAPVYYYSSQTMRSHPVYPAFSHIGIYIGRLCIAYTTETSLPNSTKYHF